MNIFPFHPCKKCIIRPICNDDCKIFTCYRELHEPAFYIIIGCLFLSTLGIISFFVSKWIIIIYFILFILYVIYKSLIQRAGVVKTTLTWREYLLIIPFGIITIPAIFMFHERYVKYNIKTNLYKYRHFYKDVKKQQTEETLGT